MKPRIEKKLSKKLAIILQEVRGFTKKDVWLNCDIEHYTVHYAWQFDKPLTGKQKRMNYEKRVSVNGIPSVGGDLDYWGEPQEEYTVFDAALELLSWEMHPTAPLDPELCGGYPVISKRLTGKRVVELARLYAKEMVAASVKRIAR